MNLLFNLSKGHINISCKAGSADDTSELESLITQAKEYEQIDYTITSWNALQAEILVA